MGREERRSDPEVLAAKVMQVHSRIDSTVDCARQAVIHYRTGSGELEYTA
jgi:hypothetical protein